MYTPLELQEKVFQSLNNALGNGYDPRTTAIENIVVDLSYFDSELEQVPLEQLFVYVAAWLENNKEKSV